MQPSEAMLSCRNALTLAYRLTARAVVLLLAGTTDHAAALRATAIGFILLDLLVWTVLRRSARFLLVPRLILDACDAALWSVIWPQHTTNPTLPGVPLAVEAGARLGLAGAIVPVTTYAAMAVARDAAGHDMSPMWAWYQLTGVLAGIGMAAYERSHTRAVRARHDEHLAARKSRAFSEGQASIAFGADTIVDRLTSIAPLLRTPEAPPLAADAVRTWREGLATEVGRGAEFLSTTLHRWRRLRMQHPDVASWVDPALREGDGTVLLSPTQAQWLHAHLDASIRSGRVAIQVADRAQAELAGRPRRFLVNGHTVEVPADANVLLPFDAGPILFVIGAAWSLGTMSEEADAMPWPVAVGGAVSCLAAAFSSHRLLRARGQVAYRAVVGLALAITASFAVAATAVLHEPHYVFGFEQGTYAATGALLAMPLMISSFYWPTLPLRARIGVPAVLAAVSVAGLVVGAQPFSGRDYLLALSNLPPPIIAAFTLATASHRAARQLEEEISASDDRLVESEFLAGRRAVYEIVDAARRDGWGRLLRVRRSLPVDQRHEIVRRLREIDVRLESLAWQLQSQSSTTTS
jgi:hypothetical protein